MKLAAIKRTVTITELPFFPFNSESYGLDFISLTLDEACELRDLLDEGIADLSRAVES